MPSIEILSIQPVTLAEIDTLVDLICELAHYENVAQPDKAYLKDNLITHGFNDQPKFYAKFAMLNQEKIGYIFYTFQFSPFQGRPVLFLEDLYVRKPYRRKKVATAFFRALSQIAHKENCCRIDWLVFKWNKSAKEFYHSLGGDPVDTIDRYTLSETKFLTFL